MSNHVIQTRRYIMHSAHSTVGVSLVNWAEEFECTVVEIPKVRAIIAPNDHSLAERLHDYLSDHLGDDYACCSLDWDCSTIKSQKTSADEIDDWDCDCLVLFGHAVASSTQAFRQLRDYWRAGSPLVGVRIVDFALQGNAAFAEEVFGGQYQDEHLLAPAEIFFSPQAGRHPLLRGIRPFVLYGGIHRYYLHPREATPILFASISGESIPVAWVRRAQGRQIFATSLGSPADFRHPCFLRLLANAILWTSR